MQIPFRRPFFPASGPSVFPGSCRERRGCRQDLQPSSATIENKYLTRQPSQKQDGKRSAQNTKRHAPGHEPAGNPVPDRSGTGFPIGREQDSQSAGSRIPDRLGAGFPAAGNKIRCRMAQLLPAGCGMHLTGEAHPHALRERAVRKVHCLMPMASRMPCISLLMPSTWSITPSFAPRTM